MRWSTTQPQWPTILEVSEPVAEQRCHNGCAVSQGEPDFAFPLDRILDVFLDRIFVGLAANDSLNFEYTRATGILHRALDEIPLSLTLISIDGLLDVSCMIELPLGLCVYEAVSQMYLP